MKIKFTSTIIFILLISNILVGCFDTNSNNETILPDGTTVTGDINQIQIISYELIKERMLSWKNQWKDSSYYINRTAVVPWDLNIIGIETNFTIRKSICQNYLDPNIPLASHPLEWDDDYFGYKHPIGNHILISEFELGDNISSWKVIGTAMNIGDSKIKLAMVVVNFYDEELNGLAFKTYFKGDVSPNQSWDFEIRYNGEFKNKVNSISFEIDSTPFGSYL